MGSSKCLLTLLLTVTIVSQNTIGYRRKTNKQREGMKKTSSDTSNHFLFFIAKLFPIFNVIQFDVS